MKIKSIKFFTLGLSLNLCIFIIQGCEKSPVGSEDISLGARKISGNINLNDGSDPTGIYVWLEQFNLSTKADQNGDFQLILPTPASQGPPGGINGTFNLYYYMANYRLSSSLVITKNGEFVFSEADVNREGQLKLPNPLVKFLQIDTKITPSTVKINFSQAIKVETTLEAVHRNVTVVFPKALGRIIGAIFIKKVEDNRIYIIETEFDLNIVGDHETLLILQPPEPRTMETEFKLNEVNLPTGDYEIIPYFLIEDKETPIALFESFGAGIDELGPNYLKLPMRRNGGSFKITK